MITGVAFVPQAPALVPSVGRGLDAELGPLRDACRAAILRVAPPGTVLAPVGGTYGYDVTPWLLDDTGRDLADETRAGAPTALLVLGDGSACRSEKAPGYLDARAAPFDRTVAAALRSGEPERLAELDADLGRDLLAAGVRVWHHVAERLGAARFDADLLYDDAPFGVGYFVATWLRRAEH